jgi:hypothetical protein
MYSLQLDFVLLARDDEVLLRAPVVDFARAAPVWPFAGDFFAAARRFGDATSATFLTTARAPRFTAAPARESAAPARFAADRLRPPVDDFAREAPPRFVAPVPVERLDAPVFFAAVALRVPVADFFVAVALRVPVPVFFAAVALRVPVLVPEDVRVFFAAPPLREGDVSVVLPRPLPDFLPPPVSLLTVDQPMRLAVFFEAPRFL